MEKEKNKSYKSIIKDIDNQLSKYDASDNNEELILLKNVKYKLASQRLDNFVMLIFGIFLLIMIVLYIYDSNKTFDEMFGKQQVEMESQKDSIDGFFNNFKKSINDNLIKSTTITYRIDSQGNIITYHDLVRKQDSLREKYDSVLNLKNNLKFKSENDSVQIKVYKENQKQNDVYFDKYYDLLNKYEDIEWQLDYVKRIYDIDVKVRKYKENGKNWISIDANSRKIDSLQSFYNKYKNRIKDIEKKSN